MKNFFKISLLSILIISSLFLITGCLNKDEEKKDTGKKVDEKGFDLILKDLRALLCDFINQEIINVPLKIIAEDGTSREVNLKLERESNDTRLARVLEGTNELTNDNDTYTVTVDSRVTSIDFTAIPAEIGSFWRAYCVINTLKPSSGEKRPPFQSAVRFGIVENAIHFSNFPL